MNPIWIQYNGDAITLGFPTLDQAFAFVKSQSNNPSWQMLWTFRTNPRGEGMAICEKPVAVSFDDATKAAEAKAVCQRCGGQGTPELHACPFSADVNNDDTPTCNCCSHCSHQCAMDI
jgi:hypothetical protein